MQRYISALGLVTMIFLAWLLSANKRRINWRIIFAGLFLQFTFALLVLNTAQGKKLFDSVGRLFNTLIGFVTSGSSFVFGIAAQPGDPPLTPFVTLLRSFAFGVLPTIIFFSSLMSILYYLGVMQLLVAAVAWVMQKTLRTSGAETLSASANIFVGQTEAPLVVKPYVSKMTQSELMAIMIGGFATVAGGVMAAYVQMGVSAGHLLTASIIAAPAGLMLAKVMQPEVETPVTAGRLDFKTEQAAINLVDAAASGAADGVKLAINVGAMLIAFIALIALLDGLLGWIGGLLSGLFHQDWHWSLQAALGYAFAPLAWLMGVESKDCIHAGELLGTRMAANEFVAYSKFSEWLKPDSPVQLADRTKVIVTYALCGFANFSSIGIQIGGIGGIAPERRHDLARLGLRAMLGGTLATFMSACVAGVLNPVWVDVTQQNQNVQTPADQPATSPAKSPEVQPDATPQRAPVNPPSKTEETGSGDFRNSSVVAQSLDCAAQEKFPIEESSRPAGWFRAGA